MGGKCLSRRVLERLASVIDCESGGDVQNIFKKAVDTPTGLWNIRATHRTKHTTHMRTKTLLLTAALSLAGVATSMAQVYSVNAVGYINLTMRPNFNLVANQLTRTPNNKLNNVITGVPGDSQVLKFDNASNNYILEVFDGTKWITPEGADGTLTADPGSGLFFFNPDVANLTVTLVGEVPQGTALTVPLPPNFSLVSSIVPQSIALTAANGFPQLADAQYLSFNSTTQNYDDPIVNDGTQWITIEGNPVPPPTPAVGQGFFFFNPNTTTANWTRAFSVN